MLEPPVLSLPRADREHYVYAYYWAVGTTSGTATFPNPDEINSTVFTLGVLVVGLFIYGTIIGSL